MGRLFKPSGLVGLAVACVLLALLLAPLGVAEYAHRSHALALRGAPGLPWAAGFNALAFVLPGLLLAVAGWRLRERLADAHALARVGIAMVQVSALAHAAQGLLPLDPAQLEEGSGKLHAMAWMLWWMAFVPGAALVGLGARRGSAWLLLSLAAALGVLGLGVLAPVGASVGLQQRLALALWLGWWIWLARAPAARAR